MKYHPSQVLSHDGLRLSYFVEQGSSKNKPAVMLHPGASMNHSSLQDLAKEVLDRGHTTILFDPRGVGYSDIPDANGFTLQDYEQDIGTILNHVGIERPILLTHSFGFMPAVSYAANQGNVGALCGISASHNFFETTPSEFGLWLFDRIGRYVNEFGLSTAFSLARTVSQTERTYPDQQLGGEEFSSELALLGAIVDQDYDRILANVRSGRSMMQMDISEELGKLSCPVTLAYGEKDKIVLPSAGRLVMNKIPLAQRGLILGINGEGHDVPISQPEKVAKLLFGKKEN